MVNLQEDPRSGAEAQRPLRAKAPGQVQQDAEIQNSIVTQRQEPKVALPIPMQLELARLGPTVAHASSMPYERSLTEGPPFTEGPPITEICLSTADRLSPQQPPRSELELPVAPPHF